MKKASKENKKHLDILIQDAGFYEDIPAEVSLKILMLIACGIPRVKIEEAMRADGIKTRYTRSQIKGEKDEQ